MVKILSAAVFFFFIELLAAAMEKQRITKRQEGQALISSLLLVTFMTLDKSLNHSDPYLSYL